MKTILVVAVALAGTSVGPVAKLFQPMGLDAAIRSARAQGKKVLVEITAEWCSSCKELEYKTLARDRVKRFLSKHFIAIQVDGERGEGPALMKRYHVVGFPTVLVLDGEGKEIDRVFGSEEPEMFLTALRGYLRGDGTIAALERKLAGQPSDLSLKAQLGTRLAIRGEKERAVIHLADVVIGDIDNRRGLAAEALYTMGKYLFLRGQGQPRLALRLLRSLVRAYPSSKQARSAPYALAIATSRLGQRQEAVQMLRRRIRAAPTSGSGYNTLAWFYYREAKDTQEALRVARRGLEMAPGAHSLWDTYAEFLYGAGRRTRALEAARKALALQPRDRYYAYQVKRFSRRAGTP